MNKIILIIFIFSFPLKSYSHGGGLNKSVCHNNTNTGDYHCHKGGSSSKSSKFNSAGIKFNEDYYNMWLAN